MDNVPARLDPDMFEALTDINHVLVSDLRFSEELCIHQERNQLLEISCGPLLKWLAQDVNDHLWLC